MTKATDKHCQGTTKTGKPCGSWAVTNSRYCMVHEPSLVPRMQAGRVLGAARVNEQRANQMLEDRFRRDFPALWESLGDIDDKLGQMLAILTGKQTRGEEPQP